MKMKDRKELATEVENFNKQVILYEELTKLNICYFEYVKQVEFYSNKIKFAKDMLRNYQEEIQNILKKLEENLNLKEK